MQNQQPYGKFEGIVELPAQFTLAAAPTEAKFPWKWVAIGTIALIVVICLMKEK